jgi:hypothetical protein
MPETIAEINGNRYRYRYDPDTKSMTYLGPVGSTPPITEEEFFRLWDGVKEQERYYQLFARKLGGKLHFYKEDTSIMHLEAGRESGGHVEIEVHFDEESDLNKIRDGVWLEEVEIQLHFLEEDDERVPYKTFVFYRTTAHEEGEPHNQFDKTIMLVNPSPLDYARQIMEEIQDDYDLDF